MGTLCSYVSMEQKIPRQRYMFNLKPFLAEIWILPPEGNSATLHPLGSFPDPMFLCLSSSLWGCHQQDQPTGWWVSAFCTHTHTHTHPHMCTEVNTLTYTISLAEMHIKTVLNLIIIPYTLGCNWSKFNMAQSKPHMIRDSDPSPGWYIFKIQTAHSHTLISVWQKLSCWKHLAIIPSCGEITLIFRRTVTVTVWRSILLLF